MSNTGHCHLCDEDVPTSDLLGHLRVLHPNIYGNGPERWPDGAPVLEEGHISMATFEDGLA